MATELERLEYTFGVEKRWHGFKRCRVCSVANFPGGASFSAKDVRGDLCHRCRCAAMALATWEKDPYPAMLRRLLKEAGHLAQTVKGKRV